MYGCCFHNTPRPGWTIMMFILSAGNNCILFDCFYCVYVIQWYIESCKMLCTWTKKIDVKQKGGMGNQRHHSLWHRVLSTSTCGSDQFNLDIWLYNLCNFIILSMQNKLSWEKHIGHRQKIIRSVFILMLINKVYEKFHNHFIENLITTPLGHIKKMHIYKY
jgi:hypothetical protein